MEGFVGAQVCFQHSICGYHCRKPRTKHPRERTGIQPAHEIGQAHSSPAWSVLVQSIHSLAGVQMDFATLAMMHSLQSAAVGSPVS